MTKYIRTSLKTFSELPEHMQTKFLKDQDESDLHNTSFVLDPCDKTNYIPLYMFVISTGNTWDGFYMLTDNSAYLIKIGKTGLVTVAFKHW